MRKTRHCAICKHHERNPNTGILCGLTTKKPNFGKKCDKIELDQTLLCQEVEKVNIAYQQVLRKKTLTIIHVTVFTTLAVSIILGGYLYGSFLYESGWISTLPLSIMVIGFAILGVAFAPFNKYRQEINVAKTKKNEVDEVLTIYGLAYSLDLTIQKGIHDILEVSTNLSITKNGQAYTTYANQQTIAEKPSKGMRLPT